MNPRRYNAWRFLYPYLTESPEEQVGTTKDKPEGGSSGEPAEASPTKVRKADSRELREVLEPPPGLGVSPTGGLDMINEGDSVRQSILLLLSTIPGERVMRPDYGCELHRLVFSPNDNTTSGLAIHYVRQALDRWEPRAQVIHLDAGPDPQAPERLQISLEYRLRRTQHNEQLVFSMNLVGD
jgi:phage baseplate assembly protein W